MHMNSAHQSHKSHGVSLPLRALLSSLPLLLAVSAQAQWSPQSPGTDASFRGMSVLNAKTVWISGTKGTFAWTEDAGATWHPGQVDGATSHDFRAVHAISADTALLMASSQDTALIYRTTDRGQHWDVVYRDESMGAFLDAMTFFDSSRGLAVGDPVDGRFVILATSDGGRHWARIPDAGLPPSLKGEGAFAASGTSLITCGPRNAWLGSGGAAVSRVFHSVDGGRTWSVANVPIDAGVASAGIFSLACRDTKHLIAVGGNYSKPDASATTVARSEDGGATWTPSSPSPATSFLSGVAFLNPHDGNRLIAVGTEGSAISLDGGRSWARFDSLSLNVVKSLGGNDKAWAAGAHGRVELLAGLDPAR